MQRYILFTTIIFNRCILLVDTCNMGHSQHIKLKIFQKFYKKTIDKYKIIW